MTTWGDFKANLRLILGDSDPASYTWTDAELLVYANYALRSLAEHTAMQKDSQQVVGPTPLTVLPFPSDLLDLGPVHGLLYYQEKVFIPIERRAGKSWFQPGSFPVVNALPDYYYVWNRAVCFLSPIPVGATLTLSYWAYWPTLTADGDPLVCQIWMEEALQWALLWRCMSKPGVQTSLVRTWNTKQDSGAPEDNPPLVYAEYCRKQYERVLANHPPEDRTGFGVSE